jgi:hypothetical protein
MAKRTLEAFLGFEELKQTALHRKLPVTVLLRGAVWAVCVVCSIFIYRGCIHPSPLLTFPLFLLTIVSTFLWIIGTLITFIGINVFPPQRSR